MRSTVVDSIVPALERALVVYEELRGWHLSCVFLVATSCRASNGSTLNRRTLINRPFHSKDLEVDMDQVQRTIALLQGLVKLFHKIRLDVEHEALAAEAWMAWLRYGASCKFTAHATYSR